MDSEFFTLIQYLALERYSHHMETVCLTAIDRQGIDPILSLWKAVSLLFQERIPECIQELENVKDKKDVTLCACLALRDAHKKAKIIDKDTIGSLESSIKAVRQTCTDTALFNAAMYLWLNGRHEKSREYIDRMLKLSPKSKDGILLRGWIDLTSNKEAYVKKCNKFFEDVLTSGGDQYVGGSLGALIGKARYLTLKNNFSNALDVISEAVVTFPKSSPALIEKARLQVMLQEWDGAMDSCQRAAALDPENIEAIHLKALYQLTVEGQHFSAVETIGDLIQVLDRGEPQNHFLYYHLSLALCRVCGRASTVLSQTLALVERACSLKPNNPVYTTELAYQVLLQGKTQDALKMYKKAFSFDDTSVAALSGAIHCQILLGKLDEAKQQLDFLEEVQSTIGKSAEVCHLSAMLCMKQHQGADVILPLLEETAHMHFQAVKGIPLGAHYFRVLNPDFILQIANDLMSFSPSDPLLPSQEPSQVLKTTDSLLTPVCSSAPGIAAAWLLQARVSYFSGDPDKALTHLDACFNHSGEGVPGDALSASQAHVLAAQIRTAAGDYSQAAVSLDQALSHNFEIRDSAHYQLIKAQVSRKTNDTDEALRCLTTAISITGLSGEVGQKNKKGTKIADPTPIGVQEKASIYLDYAELLSEVGEREKADRTMKEAKSLFAGTPAEARVQLAEAAILTKSGDVDRALKILGGITVSHPCYVEAARRMADIYLTHRKDRKYFIQSHKDLAAKVPQPYVILLLGDAYMRVQEPEKAIEVYESVLKKNPKDAGLARKIGHVLVVTHNYSKAISYYETSLKNKKELQLLQDLAELYFKLKNCDKAIRVLNEALTDKTHKIKNVSSSIDKSNLLILLARVHASNGQQDEALNVWRKAHQHQQQLIEQIKVEKPESLSRQKQLAASICFELGEIYSLDMLDYVAGTRYYKESLYYHESSVGVRLALAGALLSNGELDGCQQQCSAVLRQEEDNEQATLMLAHLMLRKKELSPAIAHLTEYVQRRPGNYMVLAALLDFLRRAGRIKEAGEWLERAEKTSSRAVYDPGMNYCAGLLKWYTHSPNLSLELLNKARRDPLWGDKATLLMVSICINPDNKILGGDTLEDSSMSEKQQEMVMKGVTTADKLLREMKPKSHEMIVRRDVLSNLILIASRSRGNLEKAVSNLSEMISSEKEHIGVLSACATGLMVMKQVPRARNHLKRVSKLPWSYEAADSYEQAMLLLADIYIQNGKFDYSNELLKKALEYNQSCSKAWEYLGYISEKEQAYKDASDSYEKAWSHGSQTNPNIGYKLAFNYLKAKRLVDAVDICHKVLVLYPNYPKIRKEILDKARASLRI